MRGGSDQGRPGATHDSSAPDSSAGGDALRMKDMTGGRPRARRGGATGVSALRWKLYKLLRAKTVPAQGIYLEITDRCNMSCPMCNTRVHRETVAPLLDREEIRDRLLLPGRALGFANLTISGGEPTLAPHLDEVIEDAAGMGYNVFLASNMLRWEEGLWRRLLVLMDDPRHTVLASCDSAEASEMNAIRGGDVFSRVTLHCKALARLRSELRAGTRLAAAMILQPINAGSLSKTARFVLGDIGFDKLLVQLRHDYSLVTFRNYRRQARAKRYSPEEKAALLRASALAFDMAAADPRILPVRGTLDDWRAFYDDPLGIRRICDSTAFVFVDPYGNLRGCISGGRLGNIRKSSIAEYLKSRRYRRFLLFARICNICTHGCS